MRERHRTPAVPWRRASDRALAAGDLPDLGVVRRPFQRSRADETTRHRIHFDVEHLGSTEVLGKLGRYDRAELHDRVGLLALPAPRSNDDSGSIQSQLGRIEEEHLSDLRFEGIDAESCTGPGSSVLGQCELELDAVGVPNEVK